MDKLTLMDTGIEPSDEMLQLIMKEVADEAKIKMEVSKIKLNYKIIEETKKARRKYFSEI